MPGILISGRSYGGMSCDVTVPAGTGLSAAIAAAPDGSTICLRGGTHSVSSYITTSKALNIVACAGEVPIITHPTVRPDYLYFTGGPVYVREVRFVCGTDTTFDDGNGSALSESEGGHDIIYDRCHFIGRASMADVQQMAYVRYGGTVTFMGCTFDANGSEGYGVHVYPGPTPSMTHVEDCYFTGFGTSAAITAYAPITVHGNEFVDLRCAVQLRSAASGSVITDNTGTNVTTPLDVGSGISYTDSGNDW